MANRVGPDETARYEPSHLDLHCLHMYLFWCDGLKRLNFEGTNRYSRRHPTCEVSKVGYDCVD